jgi:hypothetical protein
MGTRALEEREWVRGWAVKVNWESGELPSISHSANP